MDRRIGHANDYAIRAHRALDTGLAALRTGRFAEARCAFNDAAEYAREARTVALRLDAESDEVPPELVVHEGGRGD